MSTQSLVSYSNVTYTGVRNTEVSRNTIYDASNTTNKLSVLRQVSGFVTIPAGYTATSGTTTYLPLLTESGTEQLLIPFYSLIKNVEYGSVPFGGTLLDTPFNVVVLNAKTSTTPMTSSSTNYTAGANLSTTAVSITNINLNYIDTPFSSIGRSVAQGQYGVISVLSASSTLTSTVARTFKVTVYYYDMQDLNN